MLSVSESQPNAEFEFFTSASSLVEAGWCDHISSFCSWWREVGDEPKQMLTSTWGMTTKRGTYVALSANHLVAVELGCKGLKRWLDDTTTKTEDEMKGGFLCIHVSLWAQTV